MPTANTISLRMQEKHKAIIDYAAECSGKNRSAFIVERALEKARDLLSERNHFVLTPEQWDEFVKILDQPVADNPGLDRLLQTVPSWEQK